MMHRTIKVRGGMPRLLLAGAAGLASHMCSVLFSNDNGTAFSAATVAGPIRHDAPVVVVAGTRQPVTCKQLEILRGDVNFDVRDLSSSSSQRWAVHHLTHHTPRCLLRVDAHVSRPTPSYLPALGPLPSLCRTYTHTHTHTHTHLQPSAHPTFSYLSQSPHAAHISTSSVPGSTGNTVLVAEATNLATAARVLADAVDVVRTKASGLIATGA